MALYKKLTQEELDFMSCWYNPISTIECLIPENYKAPQTWNEPDCSLIKIRKYQYAMVDYTSLFADDDKLSTKQNFQKKQGAGTLINCAARGIGKSFFAFIDAVLTLLHGEGDESCVASFDYAHLKKICTPISTFVNHHPLFDLYRRKGKECVRYVGGGLEIDTTLGHVLYGRNENVASPDQGTAFHSLHVKKLIYDEVSYMSPEGRKKMIDAVSSDGCIERLAGIPDIRLGSPLGKMLRDESKRNWICNMPQYVMANFDDKTLKRLVEEYGGETSLDYQLNVLGTPIEGANSMFDMARIKEHSYHTDKSIKQFEVGKDTFHKFESILIVDKMPAELTMICFKEGTEILTKEGWKDFRNIDENEEVLTLDKENNQSYFNKIDKIINQDYDGELVEYNAENLKFSVTPNHRMLIERPQRYEESKNWDFVQAKDLKTNYRIKRDLGNLKQEYADNKHSIISFDSKNGIYNFKLDDWLEFLGWFLSEGCISKCGTSITISQKKELQRIKIEDLLIRMGFKNRICYGNDSFIIGSKSLCSWLKENCYEINEVSPIRRTTQYNCYNKKVPNFVRDLSPNKIKILLNSYLLGDGWACIDGRSALSTTSYKLASDLQELILKTGKISTIHTQPSGTRIFPGRTYISQCKECYVVYYWRKNTVSKIRASNIQTVPYKGKIYCVETNPHNTIYVRYQGKSFWSGNCSDIGTTGSPSEVCIFFGNNDLLKWRYNIPLFQLTVQEQAKVFKWLYTKMDNCIISLDCTESGGRAIADELVILGVPQERIVRCLFNAKMIIGFEKNNDDSLKYDDRGNPIYKFEQQIDFANMQLEHCLYNGLIEVPHSEKFLREFASYFCVNTGMTRRYGSTTTNHLIQSFQCMAIARFNCEFANLNKPEVNDTFIAGF